MTQSKTGRAATAKLQPARLAFLDGLRAIAALFVLLHHTWLTVYPKYPPEGAMLLATGWLEYGSYGVTLFIVVSGYSLMISPAGNDLRLRGGVRTFVRRRFLRIVPAYWAALLVSTLLALTVISTWTGTHWDVAVPVTWDDFVLHTVLLQDITGGAKINHVLWSVAVEWHIYFLFPLLLLLWRRHSMWWTTAAIVVVSTAVAIAVRTVLPPYAQDPSALVWFNYLGCFALGAVAARVSHNGGVVSARGRTFQPNWLVLTAVAALVAPVVAHFGGEEALDTTLFAIAAALMLIALSAGQIAPLRWLLQRRVLIWIGIASYSLYLLHAPILQLLWQYLLAPLGLDIGEGPTFFVLAAVGAVVSVAVARVSYRVVERPFLPRSTRRAETEEIARPQSQPH